MCLTSSTVVLPSNGMRPVSISNSTQPSEYRSDARRAADRADLLGRDVLGRADDHVLAGDARVLLDARHAEVEHLHEVAIACAFASR